MSFDVLLASSTDSGGPDDTVRGDEVWIVMKNGKVDEVFSNEASARNHAENLNRKWNLTEIIRRDIKHL